MFPDSLAGPHLRDGSFVRVSDVHLDVPLYWQCWKLDSPPKSFFTNSSAPDTTPVSYPNSRPPRAVTAAPAMILRRRRTSAATGAFPNVVAKSPPVVSPGQPVPLVPGFYLVSPGGVAASVVYPAFVDATRPLARADL